MIQEVFRMQISNWRPVESCDLDYGDSLVRLFESTEQAQYALDKLMSTAAPLGTCITLSGCYYRNGCR